MFFKNRRPEPPAETASRVPPEVEFVVFGSRVSDSCFSGG